jgi:hypothetical protein
MKTSGLKCTFIVGLGGTIKKTYHWSIGQDIFLVMKETKQIAHSFRFYGETVNLIFGKLHSTIGLSKMRLKQTWILTSIEPNHPLLN